MYIILTITKSLLITILFFVFVIKLDQLFSSNILELKYKINTFLILFLSSILFEYFSSVLNIYVYYLYLIPLTIVYIAILNYESKFTSLCISLTYFIITLTVNITYSISKLSNNIINYNIIGLAVIFALYTIFFLFIIRIKDKIKFAVKNMTLNNIVSLIMTMFIVTIPLNHSIYNGMYRFELYVLCTFLTILFLIIKFSIFCINTEYEIAKSKVREKALAKSLDDLRVIKHDYDNILQTINGYIVTKQYNDLSEHMNKLTKESKKIAQAQLVNPNIINQPAIYGIVDSKYCTAMKKNINFNLDIGINIKEINFDFTDLSRILGILLDNAIEATEQTNSKEMSITFRFDKRKHADTIEIRNTIKSDLNIDTSKIFNKGESSKKVKSGIGLWEVNKILSKKDNSQIITKVQNNIFSQTIVIEKA